jgi:hypothetical protein
MQPKVRLKRRPLRLIVQLNFKTNNINNRVRIKSLGDKRVLTRWALCNKLLAMCLAHLSLA